MARHMYWLIELMVASPATPVLVLTFVAFAAYELGASRGASMHYDPKPPEKVETPVRHGRQEEPLLLPDAPVRIEEVLVPTPSDWEDTLTMAVVRAEVAEEEVAHQTKLKEHHIKDKRRIKNER